MNNQSRLAFLKASGVCPLHFFPTRFCQRTKKCKAQTDLIFICL